MSRTKTILLLCSLYFMGFNSKAQVIPLKNAFRENLATVIGNYPNLFKNLAGELLEEHTQSSDYTCLVNVKGAQECIVTKYSARGKEIYSWQAMMLRTEDFQEASKKFSALYHSMQQLPVTINGVNAVFKSAYSKPTEEKKFNSIVFKDAEKDDLKKLKVELTLQYEFPEWVIKVLVYEKEREDDERGEVVD